MPHEAAPIVEEGEDAADVFLMVAENMVPIFMLLRGAGQVYE